MPSVQNKNNNTVKTVSAPIAWLIGFFAFINVYSIQSVLPLVQAEFNITKLTTGMLVGITLFAIATLSPFIGIISDRYGRKNIICLALTLLAIPTALTPFCESVTLLMILRFVQGLAIPGIIVVTMAYIGEETPRTQVAKVTAAYVSGTVMGGFFGRFITGHTAELVGDWRGGFIILAVVLAIGVALVIKFVPPSRNFTPNTNMRQGLRILTEHLKNKRLIAACAVGFCVLFSLASCFTYVAYLLQSEPLNLSTSTVANIFTVYLVGVIITPLAGKIVNKLGFRKTLILSLAISASGLGLTLIPSLFWIVAGITIFSSGMFICQASSISFVTINVTHGRSLATGLYNLSYYCGGGMGSWISGLANESYHWPGTVVAVIGSQFLAGTIAFLFWRPAAESEPGVTI